MTEIHEQAVNAALNFECKKDGMRQSQSGDWKLTLTVQAQDMPTELLTALMGDRFVCVMVATDEDESPIQVIDKPKSNNVAQACMLCDDDNYQEYVRQLDNRLFTLMINHDGRTWPHAAKLMMHKILDIGSRSEVAQGQAAVRFKKHVYEFNAWKRGE